MNKLQPGLLQTRQHFEILDGLRGVAAIVVVIFHFLECVYSDYSRNITGHGFLAVDFFFCLSGFVIAYAYDSRMEKLGVKEFFKSRLIRLHPLVFMGAVLGILTFYLDPLSTYRFHYSGGYMALLFLATALLIPVPVMPERLLNLFVLNAPAWSLFWEYIANIVYALVLWRLKRVWLLVIAIVSAIVLVVMSLHYNTVGMGWGGPSFWGGGARLACEFTAGMVVYRYKWIIPNRLGFPGVTLLLLGALMMPYFQYNLYVELALVIVYCPLLVALGAGAALKPYLRPLCRFSGAISYPLYMVHYGFIWIFWEYIVLHKSSIGEITWIVVIGVLLLITFAYFILKVYDEPVRRYFTNRRKAA